MDDASVKKIKGKKVPCYGGPLKFLYLHPPFDTTIPLSSGKYRLMTQGGKQVYVFEPAGRGRIGAKADS